MNTSHRLPLAEIRRRFFDGQHLPSQALPPVILHSWQRCRSLGLTAAGLRGEALAAGQLAERREANRDWLAAARLPLAGLLQQVAQQDLVLVVADRHGLILDEQGEAAYLQRVEKLALTPGMDWSEAMRGTNAIGTALAAQDSVLVRGAEHYLERNRRLACSASPLFGPQGQTLGALDISGSPRKLGRPQMLALRAASLQIEQQLFEQASQRGWLFSLHRDARQLEQPSALQLAFAEDGRLLAANAGGRMLAGLENGAWQPRHFAALFGQSMEHWLHLHGYGCGVLEMGAQRFSARLRPPQAKPVADIRATAIDAPPAAASSPASAALDGLPAALLPTALKLLSADIPVLLLGETGTGKERVAQALHRASARAAAPFVAVNCAAIPDGLVEAELFGYEQGAFTGASRQGSKGRLREAHGGVLFLDEIGDMPLSLQARLLRVLQERVVTPLGGGGSHAIDVRLICATHRDLPAMVASGAFRADLYYRLCHYPLTLPPLRQRGDVAVVAQRMLDDMGASRRGIRLSPALAQALRRYHWPGNMRQLANLLATLLALADDDAELTPAQLPDHLKREMGAGEADDAPPDELSALLRRFGGNASAAARALGVSRSTLYRRLARRG
nr:sigma-54-dependent Fis family transcriptional regulator [Chromobacterium sp. ASV5]